MSIRVLQIGVCAAALLVGGRAVGASLPEDGPGRGVSTKRPPAPAARVVMIGVDGLGARWIPWDAMPNLRALRDEGAYAVARCHRPTSSAINWRSVFTGQPPEIHGYNLWNSQEPGIEPPPSAFGETGAIPDLFSEVRRQRPDAYLASLYTWGGLGFCHATNAASVARYFGGGADAYPQRDSAVFDEGVRQLAARKPLLLLLYQGQVDSRGHQFGWGSEEFTNACVRVDANIGRFVESLRALDLWDDTAIVFVADHGGLDKSHGGKEDIRVFEVPFLLSGGAARGLALREPALLMDAASTILSLLGLEAPSSMRGRSAIR
ncbi:MAG: alkaline phosphatase [Kiritimatiellae bacterium]|nr:alkaline phosphatase [Kiritimatiellia bacterium]